MMSTDLADLLLHRLPENLVLLSMLVGLQLPNRYKDLIILIVPLDQLIPPDQGVLQSPRDHVE